jgi:hypothetical protein
MISFLSANIGTSSAVCHRFHWSAALFVPTNDPANSITSTALIPSYRRDFLGLFKQQKVTVVGLTALSKILFSVSEAVTLYATLLAPVALVLLVNSFQPLFAFTFGIMLTLFLPYARAAHTIGSSRRTQRRRR